MQEPIGHPHHLPRAVEKRRHQAVMRWLRRARQLWLTDRRRDAAKWLGIVLHYVADAFVPNGRQGRRAEHARIEHECDSILHSVFPWPNSAVEHEWHDAPTVVIGLYQRLSQGPVPQSPSNIVREAARYSLFFTKACFAEKTSPVECYVSQIGEPYQDRVYEIRHHYDRRVAPICRQADHEEEELAQLRKQRKADLIQAGDKARHRWSRTGVHISRLTGTLVVAFAGMVGLQLNYWISVSSHIGPMPGLFDTLQPWWQFLSLEVSMVGIALYCYFCFLGPNLEFLLVEWQPLKRLRWVGPLVRQYMRLRSVIKSVRRVEREYEQQCRFVQYEINNQVVAEHKPYSEWYNPPQIPALNVPTLTPGTSW